MSGLQKQQTILYVGGLAAEVTEEVLHAAFVPFGDIKSIQISKDYVKSKLFTDNCHLQILICSLYTDKSKGFGFVEFDLENDCSDALENMDGRYLLTHSFIE